MHDFWIVAATLAVSWAVERGLRSWQLRGEKREILASQRLIETKGMESFLYLPGLGTDDAETHRALDRVAATGRLILDNEGRLVGGLMPRIEPSPHLRLVVDNSRQALGNPRQSR